MSTVATPPLTAELFAMLPPSDKTQELVNGKVIEMPSPGFRHGFHSLAIASAIRAFVLQYRLSRAAIRR